MELKTKAIYRDTAEVIIGVLVNETDKHIFLRNPVLLGVTADKGQVNMNFIPHEMVSIEKQPIPLRMLLKTPADVLQYNKDDLLITNLDLKDDIIQQYLKFVNSQIPQTQPNPENNVIKLF